MLPSNYFANLEVQLHMFVDASEDGYAAVCYLRLRQDSNIKYNFGATIGINAALIGARFARFICENHQIHVSKKFFWSDLKTVLSWTNSDHRNYSQFVAFRISEILELTSGRDWYWAPTKHNVADDATKWARIPNVSLKNRWFKGPQFLYETEDKWPKGETGSFVKTEEMSQPTLVITPCHKLINEFCFSKWNRMLRAVAYSIRFVRNCKEEIRIKGELSQEELLKAEISLYRQAQHERYSSEIVCLAARKVIPKRSETFSKCPFVDDFGILRIDGRIDNANVAAEQKQPIILPKNSYITCILMLFYHEKYHHMYNEIRQKYSFPRLRTTFKATVRNCQHCKIRKSMPLVPQMAKLPRARLSSYEAPFTYTGLDFFGSFTVVTRRKYMDACSLA
ncbi:uncharacterized protein LOC142228787 [Haematobia irritans]|uniref:uncharacterized protein LOC142228787 n=1 Tax=Haematobia irritans TaxID=7368 RepID=UPI003F508698